MSHIIIIDILYHSTLIQSVQEVLFWLNKFPYHIIIIPINLEQFLMLINIIFKWKYSLPITLPIQLFLCLKQYQPIFRGQYFQSCIISKTLQIINILRIKFTLLSIQQTILLPLLYLLFLLTTNILQTNNI